MPKHSPPAEDWSAEHMRQLLEPELRPLLDEVNGTITSYKHIKAEADKTYQQLMGVWREIILLVVSFGLVCLLIGFLVGVAI